MISSVPTLDDFENRMCYVSLLTNVNWKCYFRASCFSPYSFQVTGISKITNASFGILENAPFKPFYRSLKTTMES